MRAVVGPDNAVKLKGAFKCLGCARLHWERFQAGQFGLH